jgi:hypothetical protein
MVEGYAMDDWSGGDINSNAPDCDDTNAAVHPGAMEICDGLDNNCDGLIDGDESGIDCSQYLESSLKLQNKKVLSTTNEVFNTAEIKLYPNPTNIGKFYLNIPIGIDELEVTIYNTLGAKLYHETGLSGGSKKTINTRFILNQGLYFVKLSSHGRTINKRIIIN